MNEEMRVNGVTVLCLGGNDTDMELEAWCRESARLCGQQVDWFTLGGRDGIRVLGNMDKIVPVILNRMHKLDRPTVYWDNIPSHLDPENKQT